MNIRTSLATLIIFAFVMTSCGTQATPEPTLAPTQTLTRVPPTDTPTLTPSPTTTPTATPTPTGGKNGLLLHQVVCDKDGKCEQKIFLYNLVSNELVSFLDDYAPLDVSPDGKKALLLKYKKDFGGTGDLYIVDFEQPSQITLLQERVKDAVWLGASGWIGVIKVNDKGQGFILRPDGSEMKQVTRSSIGVVEIEPAFNDGIFWSEGIAGRYSYSIKGNYWTKLDGTQTKFTNFNSVSPSGKYVITESIKTSAYQLTDLDTGESKEFFLSELDPHIRPVGNRVGYLSEDKWLIRGPFQEVWIYSLSESTALMFPNEYRIVNPSTPPQPYGLLSPDGVWILASQFEQLSAEQSKTTYYLFNTTNQEFKNLPSLYALETGAKITGNRYINGEIAGCKILKYFWIELP